MRKYIVLSICFLVFACGSERDTEQSVQLEGQWILEHALRDGKRTQTLKGAFFHFKDENRTLVTNIMGSEVHSPYKQNERDIIQEQPQEIIYNIKEYSDTTMTLKTELRGTEFEFLLRRSTSQQ